MTEQEEIEYFKKLKAAAEDAIAGNVAAVPKTVETSEQFIEWVMSSLNT